MRLTQNKDLKEAERRSVELRATSLRVVSELLYRNLLLIFLHVKLAKHDCTAS